MPLHCSGSDEFRAFNIGLAVVYPAFDAVGDPLALVKSDDRCPITVSSFALAQSLGFADPVCPVRHQLNHHPRNPVDSCRSQTAAATLSRYLSPRLIMAQAIARVLLAMLAAHVGRPAHEKSW